MRLIFYPAVLFVVFVSSLSVAVHAAVASRTDNGSVTTVEPHLNYDIDYDIGFLWSDNVAVGSFQLQKSKLPDIYIASLDARTIGLAATLTRHRTQRYVSMMRRMPDGSFRAVRHTSQVEKGTGSSRVIRTKVYLYDFEKKEVVLRYSKNGEQIYERKLEVEDETMPSDVLTTYFNLVAGVYGPLEVGARYQIPTYSKKGVGIIDVEFLSPEERPRKDFFPAHGLICKVVVDQDVFDTKDGTIYVWYDEAMQPARGIVMDMVGLGDVRGVMRN